MRSYFYSDSMLKMLYIFERKGKNEVPKINRNQTAIENRKETHKYIKKKRNSTARNQKTKNIVDYIHKLHTQSS